MGNSEHHSGANTKLDPALGDKLFIALQYALPQQLLSRLVGKLAASQTPWLKNAMIRNFSQRYRIDMSLAADPVPENYPSFNAFFTRALKEGVRPVDPTPSHIVSPADGAISQIGDIHADSIFQAKGQDYALSQLIGDRALARPFEHGRFMTVYLSPRDYHRVHMPFGGTLKETIYIPGQLFSVNQTTAQHVPGLFARNERMVCLFNTEFEGRKSRMAVVLVGAMIVAGIETVATGKVQPDSHEIRQKHDIYLPKGAELGRFYLGSTAIVLFPAHDNSWLHSLHTGSPVQMGEFVGVMDGSHE